MAVVTEQLLFLSGFVVVIGSDMDPVLILVTVLVWFRTRCP